MKEHYMQLKTSATIDLHEFLEHLEYDDVYEWIGTLSPEEMADFVEGLPECFEGKSFVDLLGIDLCLEEALAVIAKGYHTSPFDKGKIRDFLSEQKII